MKSNQLYKLIILILVIVNGICITFMLKPKKHMPPPPGQRTEAGNFRSEAVNLLKLDAGQEASFVELANAHNKQMEELNKKHGDLLRSKFENLFEIEGDSIQIDSLNLELELVEKRKIEITYQHFEDVKNLLKQEQQGNYEPFVRKALGLILIKNNKNRPPPKDF